MEKKLEILKLSIPAISELSARKLLGGDGYGLEEETTYTGWELPEVEVGYDKSEEIIYPDLALIMKTGIQKMATEMKNTWIMIMSVMKVLKKVLLMLLQTF